MGWFSVIMNHPVPGEVFQRAKFHMLGQRTVEQKVVDLIWVDLLANFSMELGLVFAQTEHIPDDGNLSTIPRQHVQGIQSESQALRVGFITVVENIKPLATDELIAHPSGVDLSKPSNVLNRQPKQLSDNHRNGTVIFLMIAQKGVLCILPHRF